MTKAEIIGEMARRREVEQAVRNIACSPLTPSLRDLCQMVYEVLLRLPEEKVLQLHESGQLRWYTVGIVRRQYRSTKSEFHETFAGWQAKAGIR